MERISEFLKQRIPISLNVIDRYDFFGIFMHYRAKLSRERILD